VAHPTCILSAAEPSGDRIAAGILASLQRTRPELRWSGCRGTSMATVPGVSFTELADVADLSASGLVELLPRLPKLLRARQRMRSALHARPSLAVFVDAPDFHLPLAALARRMGIPSVLVVPPQWWAWRAGRLQKLGECADLVLCLFRFEVAPLRAAGVAAHWIGHPAATLLQQQVSGESTRHGGPLRIAVLPGSRPSEVSRYLPAFVSGLTKAIDDGGHRAQLVVPWRLSAAPPELPAVTFVRAEGAEVLADADLALVAAGTATLEAAALGIPQVIAAAANPATASVARLLLRSDRLGLPNILLGEDVIREVHQDLRAERISAAVAPLLADPTAARQAARGIRARLEPVLGSPGFASRAAGHISHLLGPHV